MIAVILIVVGIVLAWSSMNSRKNNVMARSVGIALTAAVIGWVLSVRHGYAPPYMPPPRSLVGQTIVITGGTAGLGLESAKRLAAGGANVVITARNDQRGQQAVQKVAEHLAKQPIQYQDQRIVYKIIDFTSLNEVKRNVLQNWDDIKQVDVLLNNAADNTSPSTVQLTIDGIERQMQINHLGYFVLTALLFPKFSPHARVVNVSSRLHRVVAKGQLLFHNLWKADKEDAYSFVYGYGQTKFCNILFTEELQRRFDEAGLSMVSVSLSPGPVGTDMFTNTFARMGLLGSLLQQLVNFATLVGIFKTVEMGAATQVWLSSIVANKNTDIKGKYFMDCKESSLLVPTDQYSAARLWEESEERSGIQFTIPGLQQRIKETRTTSDS